MLPTIMFDSADPADIPAGPFNAAVAGYMNGGDPLNPWTAAQWAAFGTRRKLPIFVRSNPAGLSEAEADAFKALQDLFDLGARNCLVALDIETADDPAYVSRWGYIMSYYKYRPLVYGSQVNLLKLPMLDGRWLAAPGKSFDDFPRSDNIRIIQNFYPGQYDRSDLRPFLSEFGAWWR